ncbi:Helix-turn-helix domain [Actinobacillus porcinus]|uniref:Helix-turn-helix domain n=1 Tax=Actinobacillus porcinus TaxID=51048 RepID=A0ABY6TLE9_9PAST|nr:helix-turn-helix transcriptional regulator [Actinobacillus porcinus]VFY93611.1 Helix-turn-helix domain [Actinobacillus porcinus]VTU08831.1 Helix-turn-helix domain [Actinobacillus porcinus]
MALTEFGKAVRKARIDANETLLTMSQALDTTPAYLSGLETGSKKISKKWVVAISRFFKEKGIEITNLQKLADVSNQNVPLEGLSEHHKMLVAGFANSRYTAQELAQISELLTRISHEKGE